MESTGERFVPHLQGEIELEHVHRYLLAKELIQPGSVVLDIACGEGYGTSILSSVASRAIGVDVARDAIFHARKNYTAKDIEFKVGSCASIPLANRSVDCVVSFETIEHHDLHDEMMAEIKRVLKPSGLLIISSPDKYYYSIEPDTKNEFHVKELFEHQFKDLVSKHFSVVRYRVRKLCLVQL